MDQVTNVKVQFRLEQWKKLIAECQSSGTPEGAEGGLVVALWIAIKGISGVCFCC